MTTALERRPGWGPFTLDDYNRIPEDEPYILLEGHLLKSPNPTPRHEVIKFRILFALINAVPGDPSAVLHDNTDLMLEEGTIVAPDVAVVLDLAKVGPLRVHGAPDLAVEIRSPSNREPEYERKIAAYLRAATPELWIVNPDAAVIEAWTPQAAEPRRHHDGRLAPHCLPGAEIDLEALFEPPPRAGRG